MAFLSIPDSWIQVGQAITQRLWQTTKDNFDALLGTVGTVQATDILNGFFEIEEDPLASPLRPLSWDITEYLSGTVELDDTASNKGKYALKFNHPGGAGNGGGEAESDYVPVSPANSLIIGQTFWSTIAGVRIKVMIDYFDEDQVFIIASTETLYNETVNPTTKTRITLEPTIPSGARYMKYKFIGGATDTDPGASTNIFLENVHVNVYDDASVAQNKLAYQPGSEVINYNDAVATTNNTSYTKLKETQASRPGVITIFYEFARIGGISSHVASSRIYVNGSPVSVEATTTSLTYQAVSVDIPVKNDDLVQIYGKISSAAAQIGIRNFRFKNLYLTDEVNTLT